MIESVPPLFTTCPFQNPKSCTRFTELSLSLSNLTTRGKAQRSNIVSAIFVSQFHQKLQSSLSFHNLTLSPQISSESQPSELGDCTVQISVLRLRWFRFPMISRRASPFPAVRSPFLRQRLALVTALSIIGVLTVAIPTGLRFAVLSPELSPPAATFSIFHRKLLQTDAKVAAGVRGKVVAEPKRMWGEKCSNSDIVIYQGPTAPLPSGIPTYTVEISNVSPIGSNISRIHLSCGWFSSARLINPHIFKRIHYDDCLVNNGKPLSTEVSISFQYANTFTYPLSVKSLVC